MFKINFYKHPIFVFFMDWIPIFYLHQAYCFRSNPNQIIKNKMSFINYLMRFSTFMPEFIQKCFHGKFFKRTTKESFTGMVIRNLTYCYIGVAVL